MERKKASLYNAHMDNTSYSLELTFEELIEYLDPVVETSESLRSKVQQMIAADSDFEEEMEEWEGMAQESNSREEWLDRMWKLHALWHAPMDPPQVVPIHQPGSEPESQPAKRKKIISLRSALSYTAAASVLLVCLFGIGKFWETIRPQPAAGSTQIVQECKSEIIRLLPVQAGMEAETVSFIHTEVRQRIEQGKYHQAIALMDKVVSDNPNKFQYQLARGLMFALADEDQQAIRILQGLLLTPDLSDNNTCRTKRDLGFLYAKILDSEALGRLVREMKTADSRGLACSRLMPNDIQKLEVLLNSFN
ncbi:MAG: hypothetical protein AAF587_25990 [Bacteroidota bacterium]